MGNLLKDIRLWFVIGFLAVTALGYHYYEATLDLKDQLTTQTAMYNQNNAAMQDSLHKSAEVMQTMAARVANLNTNVDSLKHENRILMTKYKILASAVHDTGTAVMDSAKQTVSFEGKQSIATYKVKVFLTPLSAPTYTIAIDFDEIRTQSELIREQVSGLFVIRTLSLTEGVKLIGYTTLDSTAYPYLYSMKKDPLVVSGGAFFIGGLASHDVVSLGFAVKPSDWMFTFNYGIFNRFATDNQSWYNKVQVGAYYRLF